MSFLFTIQQRRNKIKQTEWAPDYGKPIYNSKFGMCHEQLTLCNMCFRRGVLPLGNIEYKMITKASLQTLIISTYYVQCKSQGQKE